jgi:hypothetical protein
MKPRSIDIIIRPCGAIEIDAVGFAGADCEQATAFLETALGTITEKRRKPEYYRQARQRRVQKVSS